MSPKIWGSPTGMKNTIIKFQEKEIKNIENINGGKSGDFCFKISGWFEGIKGNGDFGPIPCECSKISSASGTLTLSRARRFSFSRRI